MSDAITATTETCAVLLPSRNEAESIGAIITEIRETCPKSWGIIVVDSDSTDGTAGIAQTMGAEVIRAPRGKGAAMRYAFPRVSADYVLMLDADCTYPPHHLPQIVRRLEAGAVVVMGARAAWQGNAWPWGNRWGNVFITWLANRLYGTQLRDLCTGMWGFRREFLAQLQQHLSAPHFTLEADLFVSSHRLGVDPVNVPITYRPRTGARKIHRLDHLKILWFLLTNQGGDGKEPTL